MAALVAGKRHPLRAAELIGVLDLAQRLGLWLDLWPAQNQASGSGLLPPSRPLDGATLARLARLLWFDESVLADRAQHAPRLAAS